MFENGYNSGYIVGVVTRSCRLYYTQPNSSGWLKGDGCCRKGRGGGHRNDVTTDNRSSSNRLAFGKG